VKLRPTAKSGQKKSTKGTARKRYHLGISASLLHGGVSTGTTSARPLHIKLRYILTVHINHLFLDLVGNLSYTKTHKNKGVLGVLETAPPHSRTVVGLGWFY